MKQFSTALLLLMALVPATGAQADPLHIVVATTDLGAFAAAVCGDLAEIDVVARPNRNLHALEVRPSTMRKVAKADIYLEAGLSLDLWSADIIRGSRNRDLTVISCADAIKPEGVPTGKVDASLGDVHPQGNPHYWLDPENGALIVTFLAERFGAARPEYRATFEKNAAAFAQEIESRMPAWDAKLRGRTFVEYHETWLYLATRFGMDIAGRVEPLPGIAPTARQLADLSNLIQERNIDLVVRDSYQSESPVQFLERETGVRGMVLSSVCEKPTAESYLAHFEQITEVLGTAEEIQ